jgi:hypothetical protein
VDQSLPTQSTAIRERATRMVHPWSERHRVGLGLGAWAAGAEPPQCGQPAESTYRFAATQDHPYGKKAFHTPVRTESGIEDAGHPKNAGLARNIAHLPGVKKNGSRLVSVTR